MNLHEVEISTVFDQGEKGPHSLLLPDAIQHALRRLLPPDFLERDELPLFKWVEWGGVQFHLSLFLLTRHQMNGVKFFYEMISRWLLPGKRLYPSSFFATDFKLKGVSGELFTISEVVISFADKADLEGVRQHLPVLESEIKMGLASVYHANRILEIKGVSSDEKTALIQERISSFLIRRPRDFDSDIFSQMQHFLVMCSDGFKHARSFTHMSRIILVFYSFRKKLKELFEKNHGHRFVFVKVKRTRVQLPLGSRSVLGIFIGLNLLNEHELFEERHAIRTIHNAFPELKTLPDSHFSDVIKEDNIHLLYLEVEGEVDLKLLKEKLAEEIKNGIERVMHPIFMPRNEEEVMRNIITLSNQLKFPRDLPQVIISFDQQTDEELWFTVTVLRLKGEKDLPLQDLFMHKNPQMKFCPDRVKQVGLLRKKTPKEATVAHIKLPVYPFLRADHSVDLFKARHDVVLSLQKVLGEFRDYNGGMIAKQHEQFLALKNLLPDLGKKEEVLLEKFFHSLYPIELRSLFHPAPLKTLFLMLVDLMAGKQEGASALCEGDYCFYLCSCQSDEIKRRLEGIVEREALIEVAVVSLQHFETQYLGFIYTEADPEKQRRFLEKLDF